MEIYLKAVGYRSMTTELTTLPTNPMHMNEKKNTICTIGISTSMHAIALKLLNK